MATDIAELVGAALGINLIFGIPLFPPAFLTGVVAFAILGLQPVGFRRLEATIAGLVGVVVVAFGLQVLQSHASGGGIAPRLADPALSGQPEQDDVTRLILETHDHESFSTIKSMTVGGFREFILSDETDEATLKSLHWAITPEIAAAVTKLMSNKDLVLAASKIRVITHCRNTMGQRGVLGIRLQPNHPADDAAGILLSAFDGLLYGCGDAVIGVNPATEAVESVSAILHALDRLIGAYNIPRRPAAWPTFLLNSKRWITERRWTCCFSPWRERKRPMRVLASR